MASLYLIDRLPEELNQEASENTDVLISIEDDIGIICQVLGTSIERIWKEFQDSGIPWPQEGWQ